MATDRKQIDARMTRAELAQLVGSPRRRKMFEWLESRGWEYDSDVHGWPVVLWSEAQFRLTSAPRAKPAEDYSVDVDAIRRAG